jgi:hypothetical protein
MSQDANEVFRSGTFVSKPVGTPDIVNAVRKLTPGYSQARRYP